MLIIDAKALIEFATCVNEKAGVSHEDATLISNALVTSDLRGVHSHGVQNLPRYARGFQKGLVSRSVECPVIVDAGALAVIDGQNGLGIVTCDKAMDLAIEKAHTMGVGMVGVRNSNHFGAAAYFPMKALNHDMIGFCTTNGPALLAPWGGREALLCNSPLAWAIPTGAEPPIVLDMATSVVARGWIRLKARDNLPIPQGWAIDNMGEPTTDAREALDGTVLPVGGYKGYGIAVINEILSAVMTGALFSFEVSKAIIGSASELGDFTQVKWACGHWVGAFDVGKLLPIAEFKDRVDLLCRTLKGSAKAKGFDRIYLPGEIEHEATQLRKASGIPLPESTVGILNQFAKEIGVPQLSAINQQ